MNEYKVGDFGEARFIAKRNWKFETVCYGRIITIEKNIIEFQDNDDNIYLIPKSKFKFEKHEFKIKT
jgi:hypothetical protein